MKAIDHIDERIVHLLEKNARQSSHALARQLNVSSATVRRRVKRLIDSKVLRVVAYKDPVRGGLPVAAVIGLNIDHERLDATMKEIISYPEVVKAFTTTGRFDAFALVRFSSNENFSSFLRKDITKIEGIKDSETFVCLHMEKQGVF